MLKKYDVNHTIFNKRRCYDIKGEIFPSVTTILGDTKPARDKAVLSRWQAKNPSLSQQYRDDGVTFHAMVENFLLFPDVDTSGYSVRSPFWEQAYKTLLRIKRHTSVELIEAPIWSQTYRYAGTVDCLVSGQSGLTIIDWKTSRKAKKEEWIQDYFCQLAAYSTGIEELYGITVAIAVCMVFLPDQKPQIFKLKEKSLNHYWELFKARLDIFEFEDNTEREDEEKKE